MSKVMNYNSQTLLDNSVKVVCNLNIPVSGDEQVEIYDERMDSISPILTSQYLNAIKKVLKSYELSSLPQRFIVGQEILITNLPTSDGLYGMFNLIGDDIIVDSNAILGIYNRVASSFLFGHEMGHKIAKYKATDKLYKSIADILDISLDGNYYVINETFADECGNMVSPERCEHGVLPAPLDENKCEGIKKLILGSIYR